jgi:hypothetical protein
MSELRTAIAKVIEVRMRPRSFSHGLPFDCKCGRSPTDLADAILADDEVRDALAGAMFNRFYSTGDETNYRDEADAILGRKA